MTNLEIVLLAISWLSIGIIIGNKWEKANREGNGGLMCVTIIFCPIVLLVAIVRQVFIEDWK